MALAISVTAGLCQHSGVQRGTAIIQRDLSCLIYLLPLAQGLEGLEKIEYRLQQPDNYENDCDNKCYMDQSA